MNGSIRSGDKNNLQLFVGSFNHIIYPPQHLDMVEKWEAVVYTHVREQPHSKGLLLGTNAITSSHFEPCGWEVFTLVMT